MRENGPAEKHRNNSWKLQPLTEKICHVSGQYGQGHFRDTFLSHQKTQIFEDYRRHNPSNKTNKYRSSNHLQKLENEIPHIRPLNVKIRVIAIGDHLINGVKKCDGYGVLIERLPEHDREQLGIAGIIDHLFCDYWLNTAESGRHYEYLPVGKSNHLCDVTDTHEKTWIRKEILS